MGDVTLREVVAAEKLRIAMIRRVESVICPRKLVELAIDLIEEKI